MSALVLPPVGHARVRALTRAKKLEVGAMGLVFVLTHGMIGGLCGLFVGGIIGSRTEGVVVGALMGVGWMVGELLMGVKEYRTEARAAGVGPRVNDFSELDKELTALVARRDEDPDLVDPVVAGALEARASLVSACAALVDAPDLEEPVRSELDREIDVEFTAVRELITSATDDLDTQKRLSASTRNASKVEEIRMLLGNGTVTRLRAGVDARASAFKEIEEMTS